jgi:hypothetical protein
MAMAVMWSHKFDSTWIKAGETLDYRYEGSRFPVSESCVTILNPNSLFTVKHGLILTWRAKKALNADYYSQSVLDVQNWWYLSILYPLVVSISWRSAGLVSNLTISNPGNSFKCISWLNRSFLFFFFRGGGRRLGFSKRGNQHYVTNGTKVASYNTPTCLLSARL